MADIKDVTVCLSTMDNPYDPIDQPIEWLQRDTLLGWNCCSYLARIAHVDDSMTDGEKQAEIERAIDEIILNDPIHIYIKVKH